MNISPDFDRYPHGCEVVIPIVLKIPIYIEPVVIERAARCYDAQSEIAGLRNQLSAAEPVASVEAEWGDQTRLNPTGSWFREPKGMHRYAVYED